MKSAIPPGLRPPQFGLRTLLLLVTLCGALLALGQWLPPPAVVAIAFLALTIFAHVAGNAIGTRLRELGSRKPTDSVPIASREPPRFAPATRLGQRYNLGWPIVIATLTGIIAGGTGGGLWTLLTSKGPAPTAAVGLGVISFAVLGGILAFATIGFAQVLLGAIWQSMRHSSGESPRTNP